MTSEFRSGAQLHNICTEHGIDSQRVIARSGLNPDWIKLNSKEIALGNRKALERALHEELSSCRDINALFSCSSGVAADEPSLGATTRNETEGSDGAACKPQRQNRVTKAPVGREAHADGVGASRGLPPVQVAFAENATLSPPVPDDHEPETSTAHRDTAGESPFGYPAGEVPRNNAIPVPHTALAKDPFARSLSGDVDDVGVGDPMPDQFDPAESCVVEEINPPPVSAEVAFPASPEQVTPVEGEILCDATGEADLDATAARIRAAMKRLHKGYFEIGRELLQMKRQLGHGRFGDFLRTRCEMTERTAQRFMRLADVLGAKSDKLSYLPNALLLELASTKTPRKERERIANEIAVADGTPAELAAHLREMLAACRPGRAKQRAGVEMQPRRADSAADEAARILEILGPKDLGRLISLLPRINVDELVRLLTERADG